MLRIAYTFPFLHKWIATLASVRAHIHYKIGNQPSDRCLHSSSSSSFAECDVSWNDLVLTFSWIFPYLCKLCIASVFPSRTAAARATTMRSRSPLLVGRISVGLARRHTLQTRAPQHIIDLHSRFSCRQNPNHSQLSDVCVWYCTRMRLAHSQWQHQFQFRSSNVVKYSWITLLQCIKNLKEWSFNKIWRTHRPIQLDFLTYSTLLLFSCWFSSVGCCFFLHSQPSTRPFSHQSNSCPSHSVWLAASWIEKFRFCLAHRFCFSRPWCVRLYRNGSGTDSIFSVDIDDDKVDGTS